VFTYRNISLSQFSSGMGIIEVAPDTRFMMATPEKALADFIQSQKGVPTYPQKIFEQYLLDDIRLDAFCLSELKLDELHDYSSIYKSRKLSQLCSFIREMKRGT